MSGPEDQRVDPRFPMVLRVDFPDRKELLDATENLSTGGVFVRSDRTFNAGEKVTLQLSFPGLLEPVKIEGEVAWQRQAGVNAPAGVGVRVREEDRAKLKQLVDALNAPQPAAAPRVGGYRVLIVEDNPHIIEMYAYVL